MMGEILLYFQIPILGETRLSWPGLHDYGWLQIFLILISAGLLFYLLKQERMLVPRVTGWTLFALRMLVLVMLLLTFFQPTWIRQIDQEQAGKIVLGLDLSDSMRTIDQHASAEEKIRWARAMKLVRPDTMLEPVEGASEPESGVPAQTVQQQAHRENLQEIFQQVETTSRGTILERTLQQQDQYFRQPLAETGVLEEFGFATSTVPYITEGEVSKADTQPDIQEPVDTIKEKETQEHLAAGLVGLDRTHTSLTELLKQSIQLSANSVVNGVILFSDGQHNADTRLQATVQQLSQLNIPVYPVLVGSEEAPADILIKQVDYHASVYSGDLSYVTAVVQSDDFPHTDLTVQLFQDDNLLEKQTVHTGSERHVEKQITFQLPTGEAKAHHYQILVTPGENDTEEVENVSAPRELTLENNETSFTQNVLDNSIRVLLIDRNPRWEFRYLHNALERDEKINLTTVLLEPLQLSDADEPGAQVFEQKLILPKEYSKSSFVDYDLIILGNVTQQDLAPSEASSPSSLGWEHLEHFVANEGGSLVLLPGDLILEQWSDNSVLGLLAPILNPAKVSHFNETGPGLPTGMKLLPTPDGDQESFLQLSSQPQENQSVWEKLPNLYHVYSGQPKIAASNLVEAFREKEQPPLSAFVLHQYGEGQVLWVGTDATWRWRFRRGDEYHHRFWGQIARWATRNKLAAQTDLVRFGPEQTEVPPQQVVRIQAFWSAQAEEPLQENSPEVQIYSLPLEEDQAPLRTLPMRPVPDRSLASELELTDLPIGDYQLELKLPDSNLLKKPIIAPLSVRPQESTETIETVANRELLNQIAQATNGRLFEIDEIAQIPAEINQNRQTESISTQTPLWDHWLWMSLLVLVLGVEWAIRKWNGLP